jgi:O-acetyl-ADP-ribose deacetylase (regulator of RNase III)
MASKASSDDTKMEVDEPEKQEDSKMEESPKIDEEKSPITPKDKSPKADEEKKPKTDEEKSPKTPKEHKTPDWQKEKSHLSTLTIEERRMKYSCGKNFVSLKKIKTWRDYFLDNKKVLAEKVSEKAQKDFNGDGSDLSDKVTIFRGDITKLEIDAIVNAANKSLLGGGGVDGAIHRAAGELLYDECYTLKGCETGEAKISSGYKLPAKHVIHTVGPIGEKPQLLKSCYESSLNRMKETNLRMIAFPCISTGIYGYPNANAAPIAITTVKEFIEKNPGQVDRVIFCLFLEKDVDIYEKLMQKYFPVKG